MGIAITLGNKPEDERRDNEQYHSFFGGSEAESLPRLIQFGACFQFLAVFSGPNDTTDAQAANPTSRGSSKTLAIFKSGGFTVFGITEQNTACHCAPFQRIILSMAQKIDCSIHSR
jgi:hypothetical protein